MKILVINKDDITGGAAIAAYRLCKGLQRSYDDVDILFAVGQKKSSDPMVFNLRKNEIEYYLEKYLNFITNKLGLQYLWFPFSTKTLLEKTRRFKPDIIYLRNIHGGYFKTSSIKDLAANAPVVWTLSDMWSFTGHCAHSFGNMSWKYMESGCSDKNIYPAIGINTGKWLLKRKKRIYQNANVTIVTPSKWLCNLARQSPVFNNMDIVQIYNGFDLNLFKPKDKVSCRVALDIPIDSKVLMFSTHLLKNNPWKGGDDLINILKAINQKARDKICVLVVGEGDLRELYAFEKLIVYNVGYIQNDSLMATCFSASDLLIYPTKADNLPNVLLEAISCGTPCITFDVGGCKEIVENGLTGFVIKAFDVDSFSSKVIDVIADDDKQKTLSINSRKSAEKNFTLDKMCKNYYELFQRIIAQGS